MKKLLFTFLIILIYNQSVFSQTRAYNEFRSKGMTGEPIYYYMLAGDVRIRTQPNLDGEIIGMLPLHAKIRILPEPSPDPVPKRAQIIDGISAYWQYIEYEGITGYIWGGYIAANTLIFDIDNNGIDDYFHYRVSRINPPHFYHVDSWTDVVIYINDRRIPTTDIVSYIPWRGTYHDWGQADFYPTEKNTVRINMSFGSPGYKLSDIFEIDATGKITFIEKIENSYESNY